LHEAETLRLLAAPDVPDASPAGPRVSKRSIPGQSHRAWRDEVFRGDRVGDSIVMTAANGGADPDARPERRWDVALSFAGAQRDHVGQVASALKAQGVRCLHDADEQVRLWGRIWPRSCPDLRARGGGGVRLRRLCSRGLDRLERRAAFSQAVAAAGACVLPAQFDDRELPGLLPDVVAVDPRRYTPTQFADLIVAKLADFAISPAPSGGGRRAGCR
jgi:hypothetical protein